MITAWALRGVAAVVTDVGGLIGCERAQPHGREEASLDRVHNFARLLRRQQYERQSPHGEDLIRTESAIDCAGLMIAVDDVVKIPTVFIPEALYK